MDQDDNGFLLWYVSVDELRCEKNDTTSSSSPSSTSIAGIPTAWDLIMNSLDDADVARVQSFVFMDDRKRALLSLLMQKAAIRRRLHLMDNHDYVIQRSPENKPYAKHTRRQLGRWNYSVSHHGRYVCLAAHDTRLIGADLVDVLTRPKTLNSVEQYLGMFEKYLDPSESAAIRAEKTEEARFLLFFIVWALKESYVKAIGLGLGFPLRQICFSIQYCEDYVQMKKQQRRRLNESSSSISSSLNDQICTVQGKAHATIHGIPRNDWRFEFFELDHRHIMAVAEGPLNDAAESYQQVAWDSNNNSDGVDDMDKKKMGMKGLWNTLLGVESSVSAHSNGINTNNSNNKHIHSSNGEKMWPKPLRVSVFDLCTDEVQYKLKQLPLPPLSPLQSPLLADGEDNVGNIEENEENCTQQCISLPSPATTATATATALSCLEDLSGREDEDCIDCMLHEPCSRSSSLLETRIGKKSDHVLAGSNHSPTSHTSNNNNHNHNKWFDSQDGHNEEHDDDGSIQKISNDISPSTVLLRQEKKIPETTFSWSNQTMHCWGWDWCDCSLCMRRPCFSFCVMM